MGAAQVAATLRGQGMLSMEIDGSVYSAVAVASTGYIALAVAPEWLPGESGATLLSETDEVVVALNAGGVPAVRYFGPDADTLYANSIVTGVGTTIAVSLGWPS